jgi:hypothetical protein
VQFTQTEQFLSVYAQHLATVLAPCNSIERHPWAWISNPLGFEEEERVLDDLAEFLTTVRKADDCCDHLQEIAGITVVRTLSGFEHCASMLALLPEPRGTLLGDLLAPCRIAANRHLLAGFVEQVESFRRGYEHLSSSASNVDPLLDPQTADNLYSALDSLRPWGLEGHYVAEIRELLKTGLDAARLLQEGHSSFRVLLNIVGCEVPAVLTSTSFLLETVRIVENLPFDRLHFRHPAFEGEGAGSTLQTARACAFELKAAEASLGQEFDLALARGTLTAQQLLECASVLSEASVWQRLFGADYRRAVKAYRRIALRKKKAPRIEMSQALRTVAEYAQKRTEFDSHARYRELFGAHFQGVNTPWDDLHQVILWYEQVFVALPDHQVQSEPFRKLVFTARVERLKAIKANIDFAQEHRAALSQVVSCVTKFTRAVPSERSLAMSGSFDEVLAGC